LGPKRAPDFGVAPPRGADEDGVDRGTDLAGAREPAVELGEARPRAGAFWVGKENGRRTRRLRREFRAGGPTRGFVAAALRVALESPKAGPDGARPRERDQTKAESLQTCRHDP